MDKNVSAEHSRSNCIGSGATIVASPAISTERAIVIVTALPVLVLAIVLCAPFTTDPLILFGGLGYDIGPKWLWGFSTIDPNQGFTSYALGVRSARDLLDGTLPLWNPYEGLGSPLLGEMQAAALFPPTLLLLLPHGQLIEHAFLQVVAGIGTVLFLRRFGLGPLAALAGGLLFEFNGVFAWLRNAAFNPIAFLPWLFFVAETLFAAARAGWVFQQRVRTIGLGAIAAALAVYAGFPEIVYFYTLPLLLWIAMRACSLTGRQAVSFLGDLTGLGLFALLMAAPVLLAFMEFLGQAELGRHQAGGLGSVVLPPTGLVQHLLPYFWKLIFANPASSQLWEIQGGYLGFAPLVLALGGLLGGWRRAEHWLLAGWVTFCVCVSYGAPWLTPAFGKLPLVSIAVFCRFLNPGWLFYTIVLAAAFIDQLGTFERGKRLRLGLLAITASLALLAGAIGAVMPTVMAAWTSDDGTRRFMIASVGVAIGIAATIAAALTLSRNAWVQRILLATAGVEAVLAFLLPFASSPRRADINWGLVHYLQNNVGLQRIASVSGFSLAPNFGSVFGIASINYDDLPVPKRTVDYVFSALDPDAVPIMFRPGIITNPNSAADYTAAFNQHLPGYAAAGVAYVLADAGHFAAPAYELAAIGGHTVSFGAGQSLTINLTEPTGQSAIEGVIVRLMIGDRRSDGVIRAELCQNERCWTGRAGLTAVENTQGFAILLDQPAALHPGRFRVVLTAESGETRIPVRPGLPGAVVDAAGLNGLGGMLPDLKLARRGEPRFVLQTPTTAVFKLDDARPYVSADGCTVAALSRTEITATCDQPSRLVRLELFMPTWSATLNGQEATITPVDNTFQSVELSVGRSVIRFAYKPRFVRLSLAIAGLTLVGVLIGMAWPKRARNARATSSSASAARGT